MTTLKIIPDFKNKTAECIGYPSAGEHVEVCIVGGASLLPSSTLRFRVKFGRVTLALFPRPEVNETWETEGADLKCHLNLNTIQARRVCRTGNTVCHAILDQVGDDEHTVEPTLFFDDLFDVTPWHLEPGADEPYDLDIYPNQIADLNQRVNAIGAKVAEAKNAAETAAGSARAAYESAQSAVEAAQEANGRANAAESAAQGAASSAAQSERALAEIDSQVEEARNAATQAMSSASSASDSAAAAEEKADAAAESAESAASSASEAVSSVQEHAERDDNPHGVTKAQIGLGSVDNTSDMNKPVSHAQQSALDGKQNNLTNVQIAAVNSGINVEKVAQIAANVLAISEETARATNAEAVLRAAIAAISTFESVVADELPEPSSEYAKKIYLIPSPNPEERNIKNEFLCVCESGVWKWEQVGSTAITIEFDEIPTEDSQKAVRSGGVFSWVGQQIALAVQSVKSWATNLLDAKQNKLFVLVSGGDEWMFEAVDDETRDAVEEFLAANPDLSVTVAKDYGDSWRCSCTGYETRDYYVGNTFYIGNKEPTSLYFYAFLSDGHTSVGRFIAARVSKEYVDDEVDEEPAADSKHLITSGGVKSAIGDMPEDIEELKKRGYFAVDAQGNIYAVIPDQN